MATTNEDVLILATGRPVEDGPLLVMRHLPDRGTIEIGWWGQRDGAPAPEPPVLEFAAEAAVLDAFTRLCGQVAAAGWDAAGEGAEVAATEPSVEGARIVAARSGDGVALVRQPGGRDDRVVLTRGALDLLVAGMLPEAARKLATQGFGLPQQGTPAPGKP